MSLGHGASIVRDGLVLHLDAANVKSYTGSGTTWSDVSGNGNNGTLTGSPTYVSSETFTFNGSSDFILLPANFFPYPSLTTFTISLWFKSSSTAGGTLFEQQSTTNPGSASGYVPVIYLNTNGTIRVEPFFYGDPFNVITSSSVLNDNTWHNVIVTYDSGECKLYIDGVVESQQLNGLTLQSYTSTYYYMVGAGRANGRGLGSFYLNGSISDFKFYNKSLTENEIAKNYEAMRGRYGL